MMSSTILLLSWFQEDIGKVSREGTDFGCEIVREFSFTVCAI